MSLWLAPILGFVYAAALPVDVPPVPAGPLGAIEQAVRRPANAPSFPYGRDYQATRELYFLFASHHERELEQLRDALHREPGWLRQLAREMAAQGFEAQAERVEAEGGRLLWQLVPYAFPPLSKAAAGSLPGRSTALYEPTSGTIRLADSPPPWPRAVSLVHEAMHGLQSEPGSVSWELLAASPWSARTWTYSASRDNPRALALAVECGPSLLNGLLMTELYARVLPAAPALRSTLTVPSGRVYSSAWLLHQAHRWGIFGDSPTARALGGRHERPVSIDELLGQTPAGRKFVNEMLARE